MDLSALLPLLMGKGNAADALAAATLGGDGNTGGNEKLLETLLSSRGMGKDTAALMNLLKLSGINGKKKPQSARGLTAVMDFAPSDVLGRLMKFLDKKP